MDKSSETLLWLAKNYFCHHFQALTLLFLSNHMEGSIILLHQLKKIGLGRDPDKHKSLVRVKEYDTHTNT